MDWKQRRMPHGEGPSEPRKGGKQVCSPSLGLEVDRTESKGLSAAALELQGCVITSLVRPSHWGNVGRGDREQEK